MNAVKTAGNRQDFDDLRAAVWELAANEAEGVSLDEVERMLIRRGFLLVPRG